MGDSHGQLSVGQCATLACMYEVTAPKPGNVHRGVDFDDLTYPDLLTSGVMIAPAMEQAAAGASLGKTVLAAVRATHSMIATNSNLGIVLLLAPLAMVPRNVKLHAGIAEVVASLSPDDARDVYAAIALAQPSGMGEVDEHDVASSPPEDLLVAMRAAADRDLVARQYAQNFTQVLEEIVPLLDQGQARGWSLWDNIVWAHVTMMSRYPDSLIARKLGAEAADQSAAQAAKVLAAGIPGDEDYQRHLADFDFWLRCDGHRRNPGTTADLITAGLFAALREGIIEGRDEG
jgi:triphosphoribosyl-dephospho-CoA synthase